MRLGSEENRYFYRAAQTRSAGCPNESNPREKVEAVEAPLQRWLHISMLPDAAVGNRATALHNLLPFGTDLAALADGISALVDGAYAFTGAIATTTDAPFIDIDVVRLGVRGSDIEAKITTLDSMRRSLRKRGRF